MKRTPLKRKTPLRTKQPHLPADWGKLPPIRVSGEPFDCSPQGSAFSKDTLQWFDKQRNQARIPLAIPRPSEMKKDEAAVLVMKDGREICRLQTKAGMDEYQRRKRVAWEQQGHICSICHQRLNWADATVDHKNPRGMGGGSRDDRQENIAAAHGICNTQRGSKRSGYYEVP